MLKKFYKSYGAPSVSRGFIHGLAQMGSGGRAHYTIGPLRTRTALEAFRGDWIRLGKDMTLAVEKVRERGAKEKCE
jgi:hypothetical protein